MYKLKDFAQDISVAIKDAQSSPFDRFVGLEHYDSGEPLITRYATPDNLTSSVKHFAKGDILVARRNVYLKRASLVDFEGVTSGDSIVLRAKDKKYQQILPFILNSDDFWDYAEQNSDGTMSKRLSPADLLDYEFEEPEDIELLAGKLWAAYRVKESYKKLLAATDDMLKAKFQEMFGEEGEIVIWSDILTIGNGKAYKNEYLTKESGKYPIYGSGGIMGYGDDYLFPENTVIIGRKGNINNPLLVTEEYWAVDTAFSLQIKKNTVDVKWFYYWCKQFDFTKYNKQGVLPSLTRTDLYKIKLPLPPLPLQQQFVEFATQAEATKESLCKSIENIDQVIKSLINQ